MPGDCETQWQRDTLFLQNSVPSTFVCIIDKFLYDRLLLPFHGVNFNWVWSSIFFAKSFDCWTPGSLFNREIWTEKTTEYLLYCLWIYHDFSGISHPGWWNGSRQKHLCWHSGHRLPDIHWTRFEPSFRSLCIGMVFCEEKESFNHGDPNRWKYFTVNPCFPCWVCHKFINAILFNCVNTNFFWLHIQYNFTWNKRFVFAGMFACFEVGDNICKFVGKSWICWWYVHMHNKFVSVEKSCLYISLILKYSIWQRFPIRSRKVFKSPSWEWRHCCFGRPLGRLPLTLIHLN